MPEISWSVLRRSARHQTTCQSRCRDLRISVLVLALAQFAGAPLQPQPRTVKAVQDSSQSLQRKAATTNLTQGKTVSRQIARGDIHSYRMVLASGQYLHIGLEKKGIDVAFRIFGPQGKKIEEFDHFTRGLESISLITESSGEYRFDVATAAEHSVAGAYELMVTEMRDATPESKTTTGRYEVSLEESRVAALQDSGRLAAERSLAEGKQLDAQGTPESRRKAIEKYEEALNFWRTVGDSRQEAVVLNRLGGTSHAQGEEQKALDSFNQALLLWKATGDRVNEANTLNNIGVVYESLREYEKALDYYHQKLEISRSLPDQREEATTLGNIGVVYSAWGKLEKAVEYYNQAVQLWQALGDKKMQGTGLSNIGHAYLLNDQRKARDYLLQALPLLRAGDDRQLEAATLTSIDSACALLSETQQALEYLDQALLLWRALGDHYGEATTLGLIGGLYNFLGMRKEALEYQDRAQQLRKAGATPPWELTSEEKGRIAAEKSLAEGMRLLTPWRLESWPAAIAKLEEAVRLYRTAGEQLGEANALHLIGTLYVEMHEYQKALNYLNQAVRLWRTNNVIWGTVTTLNNLGRAYYGLGKQPEALEAYRLALELGRPAGEEQSNEAFALYGLARIGRDRGNLAEAHTQIEAALKIFESLRAHITSPEWRASYYASKQEVYEFYIDLLMREHQQHPADGYSAAALRASERARARSLLELLTEARADIRHGVDPGLLERERKLQQQLNAKERYRAQLLTGKLQAEQAAALRKEIEELLTQHQEVQAQIRAKSPRYAALTQPVPLSAQEIQKEVLDEDTLLLDYALGEERSFLWAVTPATITSYELPKRSEIEGAARRAYELLTTRSRIVVNTKQAQARGRITRADAEYLRVANSLSQILLGPVASQLGTKRLVIVADGMLQYLPFAALPTPHSDVRSAQKAVLNARVRAPRASRGNGYRPLIVDHEIISLPSASTLAVLRREAQRRKPAEKTLAIFADPVFDKGDPRVTRAQQGSIEDKVPPPPISRPLPEIVRQGLEDLPYSREEANEIATPLPAEEVMKALDFAASRDAVIAPGLDRFRIVHFATHGIVDTVSPELSGIVLSLVDEHGNSRDGYLRLNDIFNLKLNAELVVLSACQTALGKEIRGEGMIGLTRGFFYAGAPRVVASLWKVEDKATAKLMKLFYRKMFTAKARPSAALRGAQIEMLEQTEWKSPFFWGSFILEGEWK